MNRQRALVMALVTVLVAAVLAYWIAPHIETYEHEVVENVSEKVRQNPFLAMQRFLVRLGYSAETSRRADVLNELPGSRDVILMEYTEELFTETRTQNLIGWMERGGHLVLEISSAGWEEEGVPENDLFDRLDLMVPEPAETESEENACLVEGGAEVVRAGTKMFRVDAGLGESWVEDGSRRAEVWRVNSSPVVLRYRFGEGQLTLIPDRHIWNNDRIGRHDHAAFLAAVLGAPGGRVWVLYQLKVDNLLQLIWRHAPLAVTSLAMTLAVGLWAMYNRFGPLVVVEPRRRRSLGEHVQAMVNFAWRHGRAQDLLVSARAELRMRAALHHPGFQQFTPDGQHAWLAERIHASPEAVRDALESKIDSADALIAAVTLLQKLRISL